MSRLEGSVRSSLLGIHCETQLLVWKLKMKKRPQDRAEPCGLLAGQNHGKDKVMGQTEVKMEKKGMPLEDPWYQLKISGDQR